MDPVNVLAKFEVRSFSRSRDNWGYPNKLKSVASLIPEIIATGVLGGGGCRGSGMALLERVLVNSYRPSIVTFPLSLCISEILPLFPTPPLVSPKFPHVALGLGGWPLGYEEQRC